MDKLTSFICELPLYIFVIFFTDALLNMNFLAGFSSVVAGLFILFYFAPLLALLWYKSELKKLFPLARSITLGREGVVINEEDCGSGFEERKGLAVELNVREKDIDLLFLIARSVNFKVKVNDGKVLSSKDRKSVCGK